MGYFVQDHHPVLEGKEQGDHQGIVHFGSASLTAPLLQGIPTQACLPHSTMGTCILHIPGTECDVGFHLYCY